MRGDNKRDYEARIVKRARSLSVAERHVTPGICRSTRTATYAEYSSVKWGAPRAFVILSLKRHRNGNAR